MARSTSYIYDPETGKWTKSTTTTNDPSDDDSSDKTNTGSNSGDNLTVTDPDGDSSTGQVEKEYNEVQINTLEGNLSYIVTEETIKLKAGDTVRLKGLGKHLSGKYYVKDVTRTIGSNGYTHSATVIKTDFGSTLKVKSDSSGKKKKKKVDSPSTTNNANRTYTVKKGDTLRSIAKSFYGDSSKYTKIYNANKDKISNPNLIKVGQVLVIP